MKIKRENEPAEILHREKLEQCPTFVDPNEWTRFRMNYNRASNLERNFAPAQIDIELNSACNLKCNFCIQSVRDMGKAIMDFDTFDRVVKEAVALGTRSLKLNWQNEPMIHKDLAMYISHARSLGMVNIFFSSNGILLTKEMTHNLVHSGMTKIFISLDAVNEETYFKQRNSRKFNQIKENIEYFLNYRNSIDFKYPLLRVNFLKNKVNASEELEFINTWEGRADMINIQEMNALIDVPADDFYLSKGDTPYKCSMPFKQLVFTAKGDILPCCTMYGIEHKIGNVRDMSVADAWTSKKAEYLRDLHSEGRIKEDSICKKCIYGS